MQYHVPGMKDYKGFRADITYDSEAKLFHGEVAGVRAVITFQSRSTNELEQAFHDSVDDYLDWTKKRKSGKLQ